MAAGDLTCTQMGLINMTGLSGATALAATINLVNLPAATDFLYCIPVSYGKQVLVLKVVRAAV